MSPRDERTMGPADPGRSMSPEEAIRDLGHEAEERRLSLSRADRVDAVAEDAARLAREQATTLPRVAVAVAGDWADARSAELITLDEVQNRGRPMFVTVVFGTHLDNLTHRREQAECETNGERDTLAAELRRAFAAGVARGTNNGLDLAADAADGWDSGGMIAAEIRLLKGDI